MATEAVGLPRAFSETGTTPANIWNNSEAPYFRTLQEFRESIRISIGKWYCRGRHPALSKAFRHEAAHAVHDQKVLLTPETARALGALLSTDRAAEELAVKKFWETYVLWTEFRASRFEVCTQAEDYGPQGRCRDDRDLLNALLFGVPFPPGTRGNVNELLNAQKGTILPRLQRHSLCGPNQAPCTRLEDILIPLPTGDLCNPITGQRGACADLP